MLVISQVTAVCYLAKIHLRTAVHSTRFVCDSEFAQKYCETREIPLGKHRDSTSYLRFVRDVTKEASPLENEIAA